MGEALDDLVKETVFIAGLLAIGLLRIAIPALGRVIDSGYVYYLLFTALLFATFAPGYVFYAAAKWVVARDWPALNIAFFCLAGALWLFLVVLLFPSPRQSRVLSMLAEFGWLIPMIFLINFFFISVVVFGFLAAYLFGTGAGGGLTSDDYLNLFGYHLLDSIPALKVPETLRLAEPIPGERSFWLNVMVLVFKFAVLIPGVGAFKSYWDARHKGTAPA